MKAEKPTQKPKLEVLVAESAQLLIQLQDKEFQAEIDQFFKLKASLEKGSVLTQAQKQLFLTTFQAISPFDRLQKQISQLTVATDEALKSNPSEFGFYQATDTTIAGSNTLKELWNNFNALQRKKPLWHSLNAEEISPEIISFNPLKTTEKNKAKAQIRFAELMTRQSLREGKPTRQYIDALPSLDQTKLFSLSQQVEERRMVQELQTLGQYLYQITPKNQLIKDTPEIKQINQQLVNYIIDAISSPALITEKAHAIDFWIRVMQGAKNNYNFYGAQIIRSAFMDNQLYKLVRKPEIWNLITPSTRETLTELTTYSIHQDTKDVEELVKNPAFEQLSIIPSIAGIKILAESLKGRAINQDSNTPESASTILHRERIEKLVDVAYQKLPQQPVSPNLLTVIQNEAKSPLLPPLQEVKAGSVGQALIEQLISEDRSKGLTTLFSIIQKTSIEKQKDFIEAYAKIFAPKLDLSQLRQTFAEYSKNANLTQALQAQWIEQKNSIYQKIEIRKAQLKKENNLKTKKVLKKEIRALDDQLKLINKNFKKLVTDNKKLFDSSKKPIAAEAIKSAFAQIQANFMQTDATVTGYSDKLNAWIQPGLKSPDGYLGDLFNAPLIKLESNNPSLLDLRTAFEKNTHITDCLYVSGKMGGANDPGQFGGNYLRCFQTADGNLESQLIFFKQATDHGLANNRENIAEILAGHIMNGLSGNLAASIILTKPNDDDVYVGSLFFREFTDVHKKSHQMVQQPAGKRGKGTYGGQNINNPILGNPHFQPGFKALVENEKLDVTNLAKALMSSLLVGNYQIHTENVGIAKVGDKKEFVSLDFGGAFRRLFKRKGAFKTKEQAGQFPKAVLPYLMAGRKYDACYLLAFPQEIRESKEFITGIETIANFDRDQLKIILDNAINYIIEYYGEKAFISQFARHLDTTGLELDVRSGNMAEKIAKTKEFLYYRLFSRQLSLKNFALNLKFKNQAYSAKTVLSENNIFYKYQNLDKNHKYIQITLDAKAMLSSLKLMNSSDEKEGKLSVKLKGLEDFLNYALSGDRYDLTKKDDQDIILQAMNEANQAVSLQKTLDVIPENPVTVAHGQTQKEVALTEKKVAHGIKNLYAIAETALQSGEIRYDAQGIASLHFSAQQLSAEIRQQFPNGLRQGLTIHLFKPGFRRVPPIRHLLQTRAQSLCLAAQKLFGVKITYPSISVEKLTQLISDSKGDNTALNRAVSQKTEQLIGDVLNQLFTTYCDEHKIEGGKERFVEFSQAIMHESAQTRADQASILTFNQESQHFSFDEGANVNLSWICDGIFDEKQTQFSVTSSLVKHASLAPSDAMGKAPMMDCLMDTYSNAIELIKKMAQIRQFGRTTQEAEKPLAVDLNYILLTTLAGSQQKQVDSYLLIKRVFQALDGVNLTFNLGAKSPTTVRVRASIMNTGINSLQNFHALAPGQRSVARENRKSYHRLIDAVRESSINIESKDATFNTMVERLRFQVNTSLHEEIELNPEEMHRSQEKLLAFNESFREKWHLYQHTKPGSEERQVLGEVLNDLRKAIKAENQIVDKVWYRPIEEMRRRNWETHQHTLQETLAYFNSAEGKQHSEKLTLPELNALSIEVLKLRMDNLYFSGKYLQPKSAAIFNAYFQLLESMVGIGGTPKVHNDQLLEGTNNYAYLEGLEVGDSALLGKLASQKLDDPKELSGYYQAVIAAEPKKPETATVSRLGIFSRASSPKRSSLSLSIEALCQRIENQNVQESQKNFSDYKKDDLGNVIYRLIADQQQIGNFLKQETIEDKDREKLSGTLLDISKVLSQRLEFRDTITLIS